MHLQQQLKHQRQHLLLKHQVLAVDVVLVASIFIFNSSVNDVVVNDSIILVYAIVKDVFVFGSH